MTLINLMTCRHWQRGWWWRQGWSKKANWGNRWWFGIRYFQLTQQDVGQKDLLCKEKLDCWRSEVTPMGHYQVLQRQGNNTVEAGQEWLDSDCALHSWKKRLSMPVQVQPRQKVDHSEKQLGQERGRRACPTHQRERYKIVELDC